MLIILKKETQEYIARYMGDLSKAIVAVGFAGYFFKELPLLMRIGCGIFAFVLFIVSVILINNKKGE